VVAGRLETQRAAALVELAEIVSADVFGNWSRSLKSFSASFLACLTARALTTCPICWAAPATLSNMDAACASATPAPRISPGAVIARP